MTDDEANSDIATPNRPRKKGVPWRRDLVILQRLPDVERMHLAGKSNVAIAALLEVDEGTIRADLKHLQELWIERAGEAVVHLRAEKVAELRDLKHRAIAAAEFDEAAERAVLYGEDADGARVVIERDDKGSAQFRGQKAQSLNVARQAVMDAAKLQGLVVDKISPTDDEGKTLDLATLIQIAQQRRAARKRDDDAHDPAT
jgi:hypothetical protein